MSWIKAAREARETQAARAQAPLWTGEAWRKDRQEFRLHLYQVSAAQGVAFDRAQ